MERDIILLKDIILKHHIGTADPGGKASHGREYDTSVLNDIDLLSDSEIFIFTRGITTLDPKSFSDLLVTYLSYKKAYSELKDPESKKALQELLAYAKSLAEISGTVSPSGGVDSIRTRNENYRSKKVGSALPSYPVWCTPMGMPLFKGNIEKHYENRTRLMKSIAEDPKFTFLHKFWEYLYLDESCMCDITKDGGRVSSGRINNVRTFGKGKVGTAYLIEDLIGKKYILKGINNVDVGDPRVQFLGISQTDLKNPVVRGAAVVNQKGIEGFIAAGLTGFANQTVQHMVLNFILQESPNYIYQYDAFICNSGGYNIMDIANQGDMSTFINKNEWTTDQLLTICDDAIEQLFPILEYLKRDYIAFNHNDMKAKNVFVHRAHDGKVYYLLADFDKSSVSFRGVRFYNYMSQMLVKNYITGPVQTKVEQLSVVSRIAAGKVVNSTIMFNPYGYYMTHDLYTFILSLLLEDKIYTALETSGMLFRGQLRQLRQLRQPRQSKQARPARPARPGSLFINALDVMFSPDPKNYEALVKFAMARKTAEERGSITVINELMHNSQVKIITNVVDITTPLKLKKYESAEDRILRIKRSPVITGKTGGICISEFKKPNMLSPKFCDSLPYDSKGTKWEYDNE